MKIKPPRLLWGVILWGKGRLIYLLTDKCKGGIFVPFGPQPFDRRINLKLIYTMKAVEVVGISYKNLNYFLDSLVVLIDDIVPWCNFVRSDRIAPRRTGKDNEQLGNVYLMASSSLFKTNGGSSEAKSQPAWGPESFPKNI